MKRWLYSLILLGIYVLAFPWFIYRYLTKGKRCGNWQQRFLGRVPVIADPHTIWFHAVSVGEVNLLGPVIERWLQERPESTVVISATTRTGFELATKKFSQHTVIYAPIDFCWSTHRVLRSLRPRLIVLVELELWPNLIEAADRHQIPVAVINARLGESSFRGYQRAGFLLKSALQKLAVVCVQNSDYAQRFCDLGVPHERVVLTGSIKFDGASTERNTPATLAMKELVNFANDEIVFLAGSTQPGEEIMAAQVYQRLQSRFEKLRLILVPRHVERSASIVNELRQELGLEAVRRTTLDTSNGLSSDQVLVVDTIGELTAWWGLCQIGFVGGSFGRRGGQNMIEPAALGVATCFGPHTKNFRQIVNLMLEAQAAVQIQNEAELESFIARCLCDTEFYASLTTNAVRLIQSQEGATHHTVQQLSRLWPRQSKSQAA